MYYRNKYFSPNSKFAILYNPYIPKSGMYVNSSNISQVLDGGNSTGWSYFDIQYFDTEIESNVMAGDVFVINDFGGVVMSINYSTKTIRLKVTNDTFADKFNFYGYTKGTYVKPLFYRIIDSGGINNDNDKIFDFNSDFNEDFLIEQNGSPNEDEHGNFVCTFKVVSVNINNDSKRFGYGQNLIQTSFGTEINAIYTKNHRSQIVDMLGSTNLIAVSFDSVPVIDDFPYNYVHYKNGLFGSCSPIARPIKVKQKTLNKQVEKTMFQFVM